LLLLLLGEAACKNVWPKKVSKCPEALPWHTENKEISITPSIDHCTNNMDDTMNYLQTSNKYTNDNKKKCGFHVKMPV
jgi:hypothetical protein